MKRKEIIRQINFYTSDWSHRFDGLFGHISQNKLSKRSQQGIVPDFLYIDAKGATIFFRVVDPTKRYTDKMLKNDAIIQKTNTLFIVSSFDDWFGFMKLIRKK